MKIANLRNAKFTSSEFYKLEFVKCPEPARDMVEGYKKERGLIRLPIIGEDPHNAYNNVLIGHDEGFIGDFSEYDEKLHKEYKLFFTDEKYSTANVYQT